MQPSQKFAFDVGITFLASVVTLPLGFVITIALGRYRGAGDLGLYRMTSTIYRIAMQVAAICSLSYTKSLNIKHGNNHRKY